MGTTIKNTYWNVLIYQEYATVKDLKAANEKAVAVVSCYTYWEGKPDLILISEFKIEISNYFFFKFKLPILSQLIST